MVEWNLSKASNMPFFPLKKILIRMLEKKCHQIISILNSKIKKQSMAKWKEKNTM